MESITLCPVCSHTRFTNFLHCEDFTTSREKFTLSKCESCEFVFTNPRPDSKEIEKYYQSDNYISHSGGRKSAIDFLYLLARKRTLKAKRKIIEFNSNGKTVLDFGCGTGEFLKEMNIYGYETFGVEPSTIAREKASQQQAGKIFHDQSELPEQTFDVITLWHVLEHVHNLNEALQKFQKILSHSGTIFIAVPNLKSEDAQYYKSYWAAYDVPRHLWHFSATNMKTILEKNGFKLLRILPMKLDAYYVSMLSESYKNPSRFKLFNYLFAAIKGWQSNFLAKNGMNYSSLIYIARK